jgi:hypothetical protein
MKLPLRPTRSWALFCAGAALLALGACGKEKKPDESRTAQGEVLPGSASDAMLPLDTVRSQPPLAPVEVASGKPGSKAGTPDATASEAAPGATEEATTPSPGATPPVAANPAQ